MASPEPARPKATPRLLQRLADIYELPGPRRIVPFEGLRGLAVLLVFFVHYQAAFGPLVQPGTMTAAAGSLLWSVGHSGVDLFFVLSGFLIYGSLIARRVNYARYLKRRAERIYPTFLCVLGIYLALSLAFPEKSKLPGTAAAAAFYVLQNVLLLPGIFPITPIITVAWSLSYEFFFYLVVPIVVGGLALRRKSPGTRIGLVLFFAAVYAAGHLAGLPHQHMVLFMAGMVVYDATQLAWRPGQVRALEWTALVLAIAAVPLLVAIEARPSPLAPILGQPGIGMLRTALLFALCAALVFTCLMPATRGARLFSWTPLRWLGNMSYSYYLFHGLTINIVAMVFAAAVGGGAAAGGEAIYWLMLPVTFAATIVSSTILFAAMERPLSLREGRPPREVAAAGIEGRTVASGA